VERLDPIWRCLPNHGSGVFTLGLDPFEAAFVLTRGYGILDGVRYKASLSGCDGRVQSDGRIMVRFDVCDEEGSQGLLHEADAVRRLTYAIEEQVIA
jgi:hypothetical protein